MWIKESGLLVLCIYLIITDVLINKRNKWKGGKKVAIKTLGFDKMFKNPYLVYGRKNKDFNFF